MALKNFEKRLQRLEAISGLMRGGESSLDDAVKLFEEGVKLARELEKDLEKVERKIQILINDPPLEEEKSKSNKAETESPQLELFAESEKED